MLAPSHSNSEGAFSQDNLSFSTSPPLTGGGGRTEAQKRGIPDIQIPEVDPNYAKVIVQGFDSYQEAINLKVPAALVEKFEAWQEEAKKLDPRKGQSITVDIGGENMQSWPCGSKGGVRWVHECDDFLLMWRNTDYDWCLSVRYSSAGIWEHGMNSLRERVYKLLGEAGCHISTIDKARVSRADWAFDIYAPEFYKEMQPSILADIVAHSSVKIKPVMTTGGIETITIGSISGLQISLYDKTREIDEASGKQWMVDLWFEAGWQPELGEISHMWRLEVRMGSEWLKNRDSNTPEALERDLKELITEALITHRLVTANSNDSLRRRREMHPIWAAAYKEAGGQWMRPLGRKVQGTRDVIMDRLTRQIAGTVRSATVLRNGDCDKEKAEKVLSDALQVMVTDKQGTRKAEAARERYKYVDEAR